MKNVKEQLGMVNTDNKTTYDMADETKIHEIDVWIDDFTPCLKDNLTGEVVNTEVIRIRRKSFLSKFNRKSG